MIDTNGFANTKKYNVMLAPFFIVAFALVFITISYAGKPLWTFSPDPYYPPKIAITSVGSATIQYVVTNQTSKARTLVMKPMVGVTQITTPGNCPASFTLGYLQSCTLQLLVDGSTLTSNIIGGPVVCQQGSALQCYQPDANNILNITRIPVAQYLVTPVAAENGTITPDMPQTVLAGSNLTFTATPNANYYVDLWLVDGGIARKGGTTFTLSNIVANHTVEVTFTLAGTIYAGTASGAVYFSSNNGLTWTATTIPSVGSAVNSLFATSTTLYVGSSDGKVYYSTDNGTLWSATSPVPGGVPVKSVFVVVGNNTSTIYVGTQDGKVFYSNDGTVWTAVTNPGTGAVNSLFITPANVIYAGSEDGNVYYSIDQGNNWNTISGPTAMGVVSVHNVYATNSQLYINTHHISSNSTLPPGTIDFEYAYFSDSLTNLNPVWNLLSQITYTLFVNSDASVIHAGTQDGYVFSLTTGEELGFITYSPITSLFFSGNIGS